MPERWQREFQTFTSSKPRQTSYSISKPPTHLWVQYIGGPRNGQQEYLEWGRSKHIQQGQTFQTYCPEPISASFDLDSHATSRIEIPTYKSTFIPLAETPFSDGVQIVIALYQE